MFTFHHGFWTYFFTRRHPAVWQFVIGAMLPDYVYFIVLGLMAAQGRISLGEIPSLTPAIFLSYLPYYPWAVQTDLLGHSVVVWGVAFGLTLLPALRKAQPLVIGWGLHLFIDGITHAAYSNFFLYPLSMLTVESPVSYWEPEYFGREFRTVNGALITLAVLYLAYQWWKNKYRR
ncbi:hypothetical protein TcarDRAFT_0146 [Thermosinus carboxydivorans Nor1]|uniref:Phospholipase C/D domain-containing protein n=1 Tax=Thermosinus carboxydivorans Nor1 TaxID=401526 RepID=A1HTJ9_9FIRM|nr:hypothetical protein [Thermosinus carboxydivorans]EAX46680.1 hypothetical protein TcarDRAFT_0146 [Thermosinus carboxydivorans Nor1]